MTDYDHNIFICIYQFGWLQFIQFAKSKKGQFGSRVTIPPEKKFNRPLFPNRVKLWLETSDLVSVGPKVLAYRL